MLINTLIALATVAQTPPATSQPATPDWRYEFTLRPLESSLVATWRCAESSRQSMAKIAVIAFRDSKKRRLFRVSLVALQLNGRPVSKKTFDMVASKLTKFESIDMHGRCRGKTEYLSVKGAEFDGIRYLERAEEIEIKSGH